MKSISSSFVCAYLLFASATAPARAQCGQWTSGFEYRGPDQNVTCLASFDDGQGPMLYMGGYFSTVSGVPARGLARWDGLVWSSVGAGLDGNVECMAIFDDGTGPGLYVGGTFTTAGGPHANFIACWKNGTWSTLAGGSATRVRSLVVHDDGNGPALFAAGQFTDANGFLTAMGRWDGTSWQGLPYILDGVTELASYDSGQGPRLYAGGDFQVHPQQWAHLAVWDGVAWTVIPGATQPVTALAVHDDGTGPFLYVGTQHTIATGAYDGLQRWNGTTFSTIGGGAGEVDVASLVSFNDGSGPKLFAGGRFETIGGIQASQVARWDGATWNALGIGPDAWTVCLAVHDEGTGPKLFAGGNFLKVGSMGIDRIARWNNSSWSAVGAGSGNGIANGIGFGPRCAIIHDDAAGRSLVVGGSFETAGSTIASNIAKWDGSHWSALGAGLQGGSPINGVYALASLGNELYAGGEFDASGTVPMTNVGRWDGSSWSALGAGLPNTVLAMAVFDAGSGPQVYAGGAFNQGQLQCVARWTGTTWAGIGTGMNGTVECMTVFDDGGGNALYVGGNFSLGGSATAFRVARWDGVSWTSIGTFAGGRVRALRGFNDGNERSLYVGGNFVTAGTTTVDHVARWDGSQWNAVGGGTDGQVAAFGVHDPGDGSGPTLYIAGDFVLAGSVIANGVAQWTGSGWQNMGTGLAYHAWNSRMSLVSFDDGAVDAPALYLATHMTDIGSRPSEGIGRWGGCGHPGTPYCFGDAGNCPCASTGSAGHGCPSSTSSSGAQLEASGSPTLAHDSLSFAVTGPLNASKLLFQGTTMVASGAGSPFGDGLRCAGGASTRLYLHAGGAGHLSFPATGEPAVSVRGGVISPGYRTYQVWYRDPASFCTPATFNLTNGVRLLWAP